MATNELRGIRTYVFELDYGSRSRELPFVQALLERYDRDSLVGYMFLANNNPYSFEFYLILHFAKRAKDFEKWSRSAFPDRSRRYNLFVGDLLADWDTKRFNMVANPRDDLVPLVLAPEGDGLLFLFPERGVLAFGSAQRAHPDVFFSYSTANITLVNRVFEVLQREEVSAWVDRHEIVAGDSITERINEGMAHSRMAVLFLSTAYLTAQSGWPRAEMNYFFQHRMRTGARFIVYNVDVPHNELPPLLRDFKYISNTKEGVRELVQVIRRNPTYRDPAA